MKSNLRKLSMMFIMGLAMTTTAVMGYVTISYVMDKVIDQPITVGETVKYTDGLIIELATFEPYTLTFYELDETDTSKWEITYTYNYTVLVEGMNIEVSSLSSDITITELTYTDTTIAITFSLNQELEYTAGDILNVQFYFEAVEQVGININTATIEELLSVGFTESEATEIVALTYNVVDLVDLYNYIYIFDAITRFEPLVNDGTIVFE